MLVIMIHDRGDRDDDDNDDDDDDDSNIGADEMTMVIDDDGCGDEKGFPVNNFLWIYPSSISLTISGAKSKSLIFVCRKHLTNPITIPWVMMMMMMRALTMMAMMVMMAAMS